MSKNEIWVNNDGLLSSWLLNIMSDDVPNLNVGIDNAYQLWQWIENQLLPTSKEQEHILKDRIATLKKGSLIINKYLRKFKLIHENVAAINEPVSNLDKVFQCARGPGPNINT